MMKNETLKGIFLVGIGASIYGMLATVVKIAYQAGFTTAEVTSAQFTIGMLGLLMLNFFQQLTSKSKLPKANQSDVLKFILAGTSYGLTSLFYYLSVQFINVSIAIVLLMQSVWIGVVVESVLNNTFPSIRKILATVMILIGTLLATNALASKVDLDWRGLVFGFLAACSFATTMFASNRIANHLPTFKKSLWMLTGGFMVILVFLMISQIGPFYFNSVFSKINFPFAELKAFDVSIFWRFGIFLAVFGTILPPILLNAGFPKTGLGLGSIISSMELPVSVSMAFVLLHEKVLGIQWFGIFLILTAIVYMNWNLISIRQKV